MTTDQVLAALEQVYGPFLSEHQNTHRELAAAEAMLGMELPGTVRAMYLRTGRHALHTSANVLVPLAELYLEYGCLIFYIEEQGAVKWGIPLSELHAFDPSVATSVVSDRTDHIEMQAEFDSVSQFVAFQGAMQAVGGGLPFVGVLLPPMHLGNGSVPSPKTWTNRSALPIFGEKLAQTEHAQVWYCKGGIVVAQSDGYLGLAADSEERFVELGNVLDVALEGWDYATLRDE